MSSIRLKNADNKSKVALLKMASRGEGTLRRPQEAANDSELAFLVTHWLRNFNQTNGSNAASQNNATAATTTIDDRSKREALERIQRATSDLASAFSALGTFGTATAVSARQSSAMHEMELTSISTERYDFLSKANHFVLFSC